MIKKLHLALTCMLGLSLGIAESTGQCGDRYSTQLFSTVTETENIQYGSNIAWIGNSTTDLFLDVYTPDGDTETNRPLILLFHGGSFVGGSKDNPDVTTLAEDFAKMGYVTACVQYRLGMNTLPPDSVSAVKAVWRGVHDSRAAVRFFRKDVTEHGNTYGIDQNRIFIIGVSAGGLIANHHAYLDELSERPTFVDYTLPGLGGGIEGETGNAGYSSEVTAIVNLCGALKDTAWMETGDVPILSMHHPNDETVPYGQDIIAPFFNLPILLVNGSDPIHVAAEEKSVNHCFHTYQNVGAGNEHVPHVFEPAQYDTTLVYARNFLYQFSCGGFSVCGYLNTLSTDDYVRAAELVSVYPNPTQENLTVDLTAFEGKSITLQLIDQLGRIVWEESNPDSKHLINSAGFANGLYTLSVLTADKIYPVKVIFK